MAGRAGRRGLTKEVLSISWRIWTVTAWGVPSTNPADVEELTSRFNLSYNSVLNLFHNYNREEIRVILNRNFATHQARNDRVSWKTA